MRFIRMLGVTAIAATIALALVGPSTASASTSTQLCKTHTALTCGSAATSVAMTNVGVGTLLNDIADILCLDIDVEGTPLALGNPQQVHVTSLTIEGCGTTAAHNNCEVEVTELPLVNLLKTGLDKGTLTSTNGKVFVFCDLFIDISCEYDAKGLPFGVGAQHLTANKMPVKEIGSKILCPDNPTLDGLLETTGVPASTTLCKTHSDPCAEKDQVKSLDMMASKAPVLYNTVANVECESSLLAATVLGSAQPQKLDVSALTWKDCHTQGAADNCTVTTSALPTLDLEATALNLGEATTSGFEIELDCLVLDLIELDCTYDGDVTLQAEGALHKSASGHGRFIAAKTALDLVEGGAHCPNEVKWDATYEVSEHLYVIPSAAEGYAYILQ